MALSSVAIAVLIGGVFDRYHPFPGWPQLLTAVAIIGSIVSVAHVPWPHTTTLLKARRLPKPGWLRVLAFLAALGWIFVRGLASKDNLPPVQIPLIGFLIVATVVAFMIGMWSRPGYDWMPEHRLAVVAAPLLASWLLGFAVAAVVGFFPPLDLLGQLGFGILTYLGLRRLRRKMKGQSASSVASHS